jgi:hypothetical protein
MREIRTPNTRKRAAAAAGTLATIAGLGGVCAPAGAATLPPELPPLLAKMSTLQVSSERFTAAVTLRSRKLPKALSGLRSLTIHLSGEATVAQPQSASITTTALGHTTTIRLVGSTVYTEEPALAGKDGGRPWVSSPAPPDGVVGDTPGVAQPGAASYANVAKLIEKARAVKALGPSTVDGQQVSRFVFTISPARLESTIAPKARGDLRKLHVVPKARFEVDLAPTGLPVHTAGQLDFGRKLDIGITADVLATDFPLTVAPPPQDQTISEAELLTLLKKKKHLQ